MKKNDINNLKDKEIADLKKLVAEKRLEMSKLFAKMQDRSEKNVKGLWSLRRDIARILTLIREKEIIQKEVNK